MWARILMTCLNVALGSTLVAMGWGIYSGGKAGAFSALSGALIVVLFCGISLVLAHWAWKKNPNMLLASFGAGYLIKVILGGVLLSLNTTASWLIKETFFYSAVLVSIVWVSTEIFTFMKEYGSEFQHDRIDSSVLKESGKINNG